MKVFLSYKFTGMDIEGIHALIDPVYENLKKNYDVYCNLYDPEAFRENITVKEIMEAALANLETCDCQVIIHNGEVNQIMGEGMLIEIGYAIAKNIPRILLFKEGSKVSSSLALSTQSIKYNDSNDLLEKITNLTLSKESIS